MSSKLKSGKKHKSVLLRILMVGIVGFFLIQIVSMQIEISQKKSELDSINNDLNSVLVSNEQLQRYTSDENKMEYIEQIARDQLDYSYSDETVYYFVPR